MNGLPVGDNAHAGDGQPQLLQRDFICGKPRMSSERKLLQGFPHAGVGAGATISR